MAAEKGSGFLLKSGSLPGTTLAGLRSTSFTINGEAVDVTSKDSATLRTLLAAAGVTSMSISGSGVFQDDAAIKAVRAAAKAMTLDLYVIAFENGDTIDGSFQCTSFENAGEFNGELTYSITLESSGDFTITDN